MKKINCLLVFSLLACWFQACKPVEIDFNNPEDIKFIQDEFLYEVNQELKANNDLVQLFGEENINFGPVPPNWGDSLCFKVNGMDYDTCVRFIFDTYNNNAIIPSHAAPPAYDASINIHLFFDHNQCVYHHKMKTRDTYANYYTLDLEKAFIIGHDSLFTTYYQGKIEGNGNPTVIMLISGTLVTDPNTHECIGIRDYLFGKKILGYEYQPTQAFADGTIEIKKHPGLSPCCSWDDL